VFNPSREEVRRFLFNTWRKHKAGELLTALESMALDAIFLHPEYHSILDDEDRYIEQDYLPEFGDVNPFLHLSLHLAVAEQISIDQPPGIRAAFERLRTKAGDEHQALHTLLDCLAETIWQAQRNGTSPDPAVYRDCLARH
jgi:hypothetical protein